jgi:hypothetical protein
MQLIKSRSDKTKLGIRFDTRKRKDYIFQDAQVLIAGCLAFVSPNSWRTAVNAHTQARG